jgi:hypothetical protein
MTPEADHLTLSLTIGNGGWVAAQVDTEEPFFLRFDLSDAGRLKPVELYLSGRPISPTSLRSLPLARVEALVNAPDARGNLIAWLEESGPNPRELLGREVARWARVRKAVDTVEEALDSLAAPANRHLAHYLADRFDPEGAAALHQAVELAEREQQIGRDAAYREWRQQHYARLPVPEGTSRKPDEFYRRVAEVYSTVAGWTSRPGPEIAEANGVPVTTVHRWVKRARELGFLAPGQKKMRWYL